MRLRHCDVCDHRTEPLALTPVASPMTLGADRQRHLFAQRWWVIAQARRQGGSVTGPGDPGRCSACCATGRDRGCQFMSRSLRHVARAGGLGRGRPGLVQPDELRRRALRGPRARTGRLRRVQPRLRDLPVRAQRCTRAGHRSASWSASATLRRHSAPGRRGGGGHGGVGRRGRRGRLACWRPWRPTAPSVCVPTLGSCSGTAAAGQLAVRLLRRRRGRDAFLNDLVWALFLRPFIAVVLVSGRQASGSCSPGAAPPWSPGLAGVAQAGHPAPTFLVGQLDPDPAGPGRPIPQRELSLAASARAALHGLGAIRRGSRRSVRCAQPSCSWDWVNLIIMGIGSLMAVPEATKPLKTDLARLRRFGAGPGGRCSCRQRLCAWWSWRCWISSESGGRWRHLAAGRLPAAARHRHGRVAGRMVRRLDGPLGDGRRSQEPSRPTAGSAAASLIGRARPGARWGGRAAWERGRHTWSPARLAAAVRARHAQTPSQPRLSTSNRGRSPAWPLKARQSRPRMPSRRWELPPDQMTAFYGHLPRHRRPPRVIPT